MTRIDWRRACALICTLTLVACSGDTGSNGTPDAGSSAQDATTTTGDATTTATATPDDTTATADDVKAPDEDASTPPVPDVVIPAPDVDEDAVEAPNEDWDGDGLTNLQEAYVGSDPNNPDTDGDGLNDSEEFAAGSNVFVSDSDWDGLSDSDEVDAGTNPLAADTDGDGFSDSEEVTAGTDPLNRWSWTFGGEQWPDMSAFGETTYPSGWAQGDVAPEISLVDQFGQALSLAQFHGYVVLFDFSAGWCMPCREAAKTAEALWETHRDQGFMIVHLLIEGNVAGMDATAGLLNEWRAQYGLSFPVTMEPEGGSVYTTFTEKSGIYPGSLPFLVLLDRDMRIDSGYGAGQEAAIEARVEELLGAPVPDVQGVATHSTGGDAADICDQDQDGARHPSCGGGDCDDGNTGIHPDADELCDLVDHDCDGWLHHGAVDAETRYADTDQDGYGSPEITIQSCGTPWPHVDNADDCNDGDDAINPETIWYQDLDEDGLGNPEVTVVACEPPDGYVSNSGDTDDNDGTSLGCWAQITVGRDHSCGLKTDGSITCWGCNTNDQHNAPSGTFVTIDAGMTHTCAMDAAGQISCWGSNTMSSSVAPTETFLSFQCGLNFCCGITDAATDNITCWGANDYDQGTPPPGTFTEVSVGNSRHACATNAAGEMTCWGYDYGQTGAANPLAVPDGVYAHPRVGHKYTMAMKNDGTAIGWGANTSGQATPPPDTFLDIRGGIVHSCGLRDDGSVTCWGSNSLDRTDSPGGDWYTQIDVGQFHSCALGLDGLFSCWGSGTCHEDFCPGNFDCAKMVAPPCGQ